MNKIEYPLDKVLEIKIQRVDKARRVVKEREKELLKQQEKLKKVVAARDKVKNHYQDKLDQMRQAFDEGTNSQEIKIMKRYIKVVQGQLVEEEKKVEAQQDLVDVAEKNLQLAREELAKKEKEVEKLEMHKVEWVKVAKKEMLIEEEKEFDEIGNVLFLSNRKKREK